MLQNNIVKYWKTKVVASNLTFEVNFPTHVHCISLCYLLGAASGHNYDFPLSWTDEPYIPSTQKYKNAKVGDPSYCLW